MSILSSYSSSSSSASPASTRSTIEHDTPSSEHFVNGEIVCTGGLFLQVRDLTHIKEKAREAVYSRGRSVNMAVRRRYGKMKSTTAKRVKKHVSSFFKRVCGLH